MIRELVYIFELTDNKYHHNQDTYVTVSAAHHHIKYINMNSSQKLTRTVKDKLLSSAISPLSGWQTIKFSTSTPNAFEYAGSKACSASTSIALPPSFCIITIETLHVRHDVNNNVLEHSSTLHIITEESPDKFKPALLQLHGVQWLSSHYFLGQISAQKDAFVIRLFVTESNQKKWEKTKLQ